MKLWARPSGSRLPLPNLSSSPCRFTAAIAPIHFVLLSFLTHFLFIPSSISHPDENKPTAGQNFSGLLGLPLRPRSASKFCQHCFRNTCLLCACCCSSRDLPRPLQPHQRGCLPVAVGGPLSCWLPLQELLSLPVTPLPSIFLWPPLCHYFGLSLNVASLCVAALFYFPIARITACYFLVHLEVNCLFHWNSVSHHQFY